MLTIKGGVGEEQLSLRADEIREMKEAIEWADALYGKQIKFPSASHVTGHLNALAQTGTDEDAFHVAFTLLRDDVAADAQTVGRIASAYAGKDLQAGDRDSGLGAIEAHFYDQNKALAHANNREVGGRTPR